MAIYSLTSRRYLHSMILLDKPSPYIMIQLGVESFEILNTEKLQLCRVKRVGS